MPQPGNGRIASLMPEFEDRGVMMFFPANEPEARGEPFVEFGFEDDGGSDPRPTN